VGNSNSILGKQRRMISDYVMTQNCEALISGRRCIGKCRYGMDSQYVQRYVDANGYVPRTRAMLEAHAFKPYTISY